MNCIQCGKEEKCTFIDNCKFRPRCRKCHCCDLTKADLSASGGGGGGKIKKTRKLKTIYRLNNLYGNCIGCGKHGSLDYESKCEGGCIICKLPLPQKMIDLPQRDITTISSIEDLEKTKGEISWTKDRENLGVYVKRFIDDDRSSCGKNETFFALQFSEKKWIPEQRLFPLAQVAVSSSGGGCGSATASNKNDTVKIAIRSNQKIITPTNIENIIDLINEYSILEEIPFEFCYLDKNKSIIELGIVIKNIDPEFSRRMYISFSKNKKIFGGDSCRKFIKDNSFEGSIEEV